MSLQLAMLKSAALLVPGSQREEWLKEWLAELWYVDRAQCNTNAFCWGAIRDALCIRLNTPMPRLMESPARCVAVLAALAAVAGTIAMGFSEERDANPPLRRPDAWNLVVISPAERVKALGPRIPIEQYRTWTETTQHLFTGVAFYRPVVMKVQVAKGQTRNFTIGHASANLFELLNIPRARREIPDAGLPAERSVILADTGDLPGHIEGWVLDNDTDLSALPADTKGFVVARVRASAFPPRAKGLWHMRIPNEVGGYDHFDCTSAAEQVPGPLVRLLMIMMYVCVIVPVTTSLSLGEYPANHHWPALSIRLRRWIFLATKVALVLVIAYSGSVVLGYLNPKNGTLGLAIQLLVLGCVFAFRWILVDQRNRCPVCLRLLGNPARVGQASRIFLGWNGMELMCRRGHGLLHVPEMPTSWYSTQRWLYLDCSWSGLFSR